MPDVTVVIPCYNNGEYLHDAVGSVADQASANVEIIIVNDGSTDDRTKRNLSACASSGITVLYQQNQGVSAARNRGIAEASGHFILPLDADDKIHPDYIAEAVALLEHEPGCGLVYCECEFFGDRKGLWKLPPYSLDAMLLDNVIFSSAIFRKADWERTGGYRANMSDGYEDWDMWLSLAELGRTFKRIPGVRFYYRMLDGTGRHRATMRRQVDIEMRRQLIDNHPGLYTAWQTRHGPGASVHRAVTVRYVAAVQGGHWRRARALRAVNRLLLSVFGTPS